MTGTYVPTDALVAPGGLAAPEATAAEALVHRVVRDGPVGRRTAGVVRPWSALVCGMPDDRTLLVVDWLLLACREAGVVAQAIPIAGHGDQPHGMYVEVAADASVEGSLGDVPWGAVDLVVAGEHLELMRAIDGGYVAADVTTIVASCRRTFTRVERDVAPQHVLSEREIDATARAASLAYFAFDGPEVASWYRLPSDAQPGLLLGALCGTGLTGLDEGSFDAAIAALGIDADLHREAFRRGTRLGRRPGGRVRRVKTAYQFTRRRRALVDHRSRRAFEELVGRAEELVHPEHLAALQEAIYLLCEFQDAEWATTMVGHVADLARAEQEALGVDGATMVDPTRSIVPDAIRALAAMLVWPDAAWIANRKRRPARIKGIRTGFGITRRDAYRLVDHVPLDALDRAAASSTRLGTHGVDAAAPPLLQPVRVERIETTSLRGAMRLRRMAAGATRRTGSPRQRLELDTTATWLEAMHDALRCDHEIARIVARSGTIVQGAGAVREANRATAHAFWGRIVRQSIAMDLASGAGGEPAVARRVVPFAWEQLCRSGPLALWEYAAQVLGIALAQARGLDRAQVIALADALCEPRRPVEGR